MTRSILSRTYPRRFPHRRLQYSAFSNSSSITHNCNPASHPSFRLFVLHLVLNHHKKQSTAVVEGSLIIPVNFWVSSFLSTLHFHSICPFRFRGTLHQVLQYKCVKKVHHSCLFKLHISHLLLTQTSLLTQSGKKARMTMVHSYICRSPSVYVKIHGIFLIRILKNNLYINDVGGVWTTLTQSDLTLFYCTVSFSRTSTFNFYVPNLKLSLRLELFEAFSVSNSRFTSRSPSSAASARPLCPSRDGCRCMIDLSCSTFAKRLSRRKFKLWPPLFLSHAHFCVSRVPTRFSSSRHSGSRWRSIWILPTIFKPPRRLCILSFSPLSSIHICRTTPQRVTWPSMASTRRSKSISFCMYHHPRV